MRSFFHTICLACCSVGLLSLTQCGGSSSDAKGYAPEILNDTILSISLGNVQYDGDETVSIPRLFDLAIQDGVGAIYEKGSESTLWNGSATVTYYKTGSHTARLGVSWTNLDSSTNVTTTYNLTVNPLTFENSQHATGDGIIAFQKAGEDSEWDSLTCDVDITLPYQG